MLFKTIYWKFLSPNHNLTDEIKFPTFVMETMHLPCLCMCLMKPFSQSNLNREKLKIIWNEKNIGKWIWHHRSPGSCGLSRYYGVVNKTKVSPLLNPLKRQNALGRLWI